jgi:hypothetical protein
VDTDRRRRELASYACQSPDKEMMGSPLSGLDTIKEERTISKRPVKHTKGAKCGGFVSNEF